MFYYQYVDDRSSRIHFSKIQLYLIKESCKDMRPSLDTIIQMQIRI